MRSALLAAVLLSAPVAVHAQSIDTFGSALSAVEGQALNRLRAPEEDRVATQHYRNGWDLIRAEKWDEAAQEFQATIDLKPDYKLGYYGLGRASMGQKKFVEAIRAYEKCRDLYEGQASVNITNAQEAERIMQDDLTAIDMTISRLQSGPQTPQTSMQIAQLNMQKDRIKNRTGNANNMSLTSPVPPFVSLALGSAYFRSQRLADAEQAYKKAIDGDPKYGEAHNNLAALYLMTGRFEEAAAHVKAAEKAGFHVNPAMKQEIDAKRKGGE